MEERGLVYEEQPLILAPSGFYDPNFFPEHPKTHWTVCLGCTRSVLSSGNNSNCSSCGWILCQKSCKSTKFHSSLECGVFSQNAIRSCNTLLRYIFPLRFVLLERCCPHDWEKLMALPIASSFTDIDEEELKSTWSFITDQCKIDTDIVTLKRIMNVIKTFQIFFPKTTAERGARYYGSAIYEFASGAAHCCMARGVWTIKQNFNFLIFSVDPIKYERMERKLSVIRDQNCLMYGNFKRREHLGINFPDHPVCSCFRCSDPTENGSYFSAVICQSCLSHSIRGDDSNLSILLQESNVDGKEQSWYCVNCKEVTHENDIKKINDEAEEELENILCSLKDEETIFYLLDEFILKYSGNIFYKNHYIVVRAMQNWIENVSIPIQLGKTTCAWQRAKLYSKFIRRVNQCLDIYSMILPNTSFEQVMLLHFKKVVVSEIYFYSAQLPLADLLIGSTVVLNSSATRRNASKVLALVEEALAVHKGSSLLNNFFVDFRTDYLLLLQERLRRQMC